MTDTRVNRTTQMATRSPEVTPSARATLQRVCACGNHTHGAETCEHCRKKRAHANEVLEASSITLKPERPSRSPVQVNRASPKRLQRQRIGWAGSGASSLNAKENVDRPVRRIPLDGLKQGNQLASGGSAESAAGRTIVLIHQNFDVKQPAQVLLHFHGRNIGYRQGTGGYQDRDAYNIDQQIAHRPQMIAVLPQGTSETASFGERAPDKSNPKETPSDRKQFDSNAYFSEVFSALQTLGVLASAPKISGVLLTGHSGAGELINEKLLSGASGSSLPAQLREVALFDAINGPREFNAIKSWVRQQLDRDLTELKARSTEPEQMAYLRGSVRFRAFFSHTDNGSYARWHVGPVPKGANINDNRSLEQWIADWFKDNGAKIQFSAVLTELQNHYRVVDTGHQDHAKVMSRGDRLKEAVDLMRSPAGTAMTATTDRALAPPIVHETLESSGQVLDADTRDQMETRFGFDFSRVRVHTDAKAAASARAVDALAYTVGHDVVFGAGQYRPDSNLGQHLLAHELAHVVQQNGATTSSPPQELEIGPTDDPFEREAAGWANDITSGENAPSLGSPRLQRAPDQEALRQATCEAAKKPDPLSADECSYKRPEDCPTYEEWIGTFTRLRTFDARATPQPTTQGAHVFKIIGAGPAARKPTKPDDKGAPPPSTRLKTGEVFIDHPTDEWVKTCLPDNLRATAYQLPSDCADIAVILRHVWLAAHHRTEQYGDWVVGDKAGGAAQNRVAQIIDQVYTGNVAQMVNPYADATGNPLLSFAELQPLLHPGDVLVWWHYDNGFDKPHTGGHTLTIAGIERDGDKIKRITSLQGNEPIFGEANPYTGPIKDDDDKGKIIKELKLADTKETRAQLGHAPGRRVEVNALGEQDFGNFQRPAAKKGGNPQNIWKWGAETLLIAAGPPRTAKRPPMQKPAQKGDPTVRKISDWHPALRAATKDSLQPTFEAALFETRAMIEGGQAFSAAEATALGLIAGESLWRLAKAAGGRGADEHFDPLHRLRAVIRSLGGISRRPASQNPNADTLRSRFEEIDSAFELGARGATSVNFTRRARRGVQTLNVLLTGFDPFHAGTTPPQPGEWNPSGAAVMALDGTTVDVDRGAQAALEGVVLPVSFTEFRGSKTRAPIVEQVVSAHAGNVDAVITTSMDASIEADQPVRIEEFAVGVHRLERLKTHQDFPAEGPAKPQLEAIPPGQAGSPLGPAITETTKDAEQIAAGVAVPAKGRSPGIPRPAVGTDITFELTSADAVRLRKAVGQPPASGTRVVIEDVTVLRRIISGMQRSTADPTRISFQLGQQRFDATVIEGPGGSFLSNEVSFRALRALGAARSPRDPISFHVHTQGGETIPQDSSTPQARKQQREAVGRASGVRSHLIETLRSIVRSTVRVILNRRGQGGSP
jgi:hypothetical protein